MDEVGQNACLNFPTSFWICRTLYICSFKDLHASEIGGFGSLLRKSHLDASGRGVFFGSKGKEKEMY